MLILIVLLKKLIKVYQLKVIVLYGQDFFASSWKVQTTGVRAKDDIRKFKPWSNIKKPKFI